MKSTVAEMRRQTQRHTYTQKMTDVWYQERASFRWRHWMSGLRNIYLKRIASFTLVLNVIQKNSVRNMIGRMKIWHNSFLAILLAVTMVAALVAPHGANALPRSVSADEGSSFQITSAMMFSDHGTAREVMDECLAMLGHCATVLCGTHHLGYPNAAKVVIHRTTFKAQFCSIVSSVDIPPPRG